MSDISMNKTQIVTLRVPLELKARLERQAKHQGVSLNNLANYLLTTQLSQLETLEGINQRLQTRNLESLKQTVGAILKQVPTTSTVPEWDRL